MVGGGKPASCGEQLCPEEDRLSRKLQHSCNWAEVGGVKDTCPSQKTSFNFAPAPRSVAGLTLSDFKSSIQILGRCLTFLASFRMNLLLCLMMIEAGGRAGSQTSPEHLEELF